MATITMYLKYQNDDLYYSMDNVSFSPLEEDTVTGVDSGDTVVWKLTDNSNIRKINNINVNEDKGGNRSSDIWDKKPKTNDGGQTFVGETLSGLGNTPKYNGYTIKYKTDQGDKEKDPEIRIPSGGGGG